MSSVNLVILMGRLGKDPEISYTQTGTPRCKFSLATSKKRDDGTGNTVERTEWHRITVWGKQAENATKYLHKGDLVHLEGELTYYEFEDSKTQQKVRISEIVAFRVTFMPKGTTRRQAQGDGPDQRDHADPQAGAAQGEGASGSYGPPDGDDDIPF